MTSGHKAVFAHLVNVTDRKTDIVSDCKPAGAGEQLADSCCRAADAGSVRRAGLRCAAEFLGLTASLARARSATARADSGLCSFDPHVNNRTIGTLKSVHIVLKSPTVDSARSTRPVLRLYSTDRRNDIMTRYHADN